MTDDLTTSEPAYAGQTALQLPVLCEQCHLNPVMPARGKVVARFCSGRCRAGWHNERKRIIYRAVLARLAEASALIASAGEEAARLLPKARP